ncbi:hypothetical protein CAPTEDRAFT_220865 [Capitella teleta]|uniref:AH domain-containing protein n=1 Tax=Capitella teleta TaxID=283909 RepID=R7VLW3_CAPTE|nr:hypothetical protein CAPTEDRAFT_220865 [Capitella teleta]|eukprot:ELU17970.1 hypothetical protein CAPTEDRAFT_220865 [Capitella teleta]
MQHNEQSTIHKMKETYWTTKQVVMKRLGKKEDEHIVASDQQLDAKLEVFLAIRKSSVNLMKGIEKYQEAVCALSQEENGMGRFLKHHSQHNKTRAGKMMSAVGKAQSFSSQQRLALRVPLVRLYQEVETFRYRAISDCLVTINRMEASRTEYRAALLWMKDASDELDPDTYKQLEKFRKVQAQVKQKKAKFDKLKLDTMQKIDLLAASRSNMYSHVLANYQTTLLHFWEKTSRTMSAVAESFKGYQYYEFNMLKELAEPSKKLAEAVKEGEDTDGYYQFARCCCMSGALAVTVSSSTAILRRNPSLTCSPVHDLLNDDLLAADAEKDDMALLNEILNAPTTGGDDFTQEWQAVFGAGAPSLSSASSSMAPGGASVGPPPNDSSQFLPSNLLDINSGLHSMNLQAGAAGAAAASAPVPQKQSSKKGEKSDMSAWFNLFADLDPLSNPDAVGKTQEQMSEALM